MSKASTFSLPSQKRKESLVSAVTRYSGSVAGASQYLMNRGISSQVAASRRLGYVADPMPGHERFAGYLVIPYVTPGGVVCLKFRCIQSHECDGHPKYDSELGSGTYLYGVTALQVDSTFVCITEGELDCIIANDVASIPAVGVSGSSKWKPHWQYMFEGYPDVVVLADGDTAGQALAKSVTTAIRQARVVPMPDGHDVNTFVTEHGPQALRERIGLR